MDNRAKTIAVVRGGSTADIEQTFRTLVDHWQPTVRLAGLIAEVMDLRTGLATPAFCETSRLQNGFRSSRIWDPAQLSATFTGRVR